MSIAVLGVACAMSKPVTIFPEDSHFCEHCPCSDGVLSSSCPMHDATLCSLPALKRTLPNGPYLRCGKYLLYEESGLDQGETWLFDEATGALVAVRLSHGISAMMCRDGYRTYSEQRPSGFVFPPSDTCKPAGALYGDPTE